MGTFGERLRDSMLIAGVGEKHVARARDVSVKTVRNWLEMKDATLSGVHLVELGMLLGVSVRWLGIGKGNPAPAHLTVRRSARVTM